MVEHQIHNHNMLLIESENKFSKYFNNLNNLNIYNIIFIL